MTLNCIRAVGRARASTAVDIKFFVYAFMPFNWNIFLAIFACLATIAIDNQQMCATTKTPSIKS